MAFGFNEEIPDISPKIGDTPLERVTDFNYLGILLNEKLDFIKHEDKVYNNVLGKLHQFGNIRTYLDVPDALCIYKTMILPLMDYMDIVWDKQTVGFSYRFQMLQNTALRIAYKVRLGPNPLYNTTQLHDISKCKSLKDRRDMHILFYAYSLQFLPGIVDERQRNTRYNTGLRYIQRFSRNPVVFKSFFERAIRQWNKLKPEISNTLSLKLFKQKIKEIHPQCYMINPGVQF